MGRFAVDVLEVPTEPWKAQIDQAGEPPLGISQFMGNETPLSAKQLKLFGVCLELVGAGGKSPSRTVRAMKRASSASVLRPRKCVRARALLLLRKGLKTCTAQSRSSRRRHRLIQ